MLKKITAFLFGLFIVFSIASCSSADKTSKEEKKEEKVEKPAVKLPIREVALNVEEINTWLDLMPGPDDPKFHVSGKISLKDSSTYNLKNLELENVKVYQNDKMIYYINPTVRVEGEQEENIDLIFSTLTGLSPVPTFDDGTPVSIELIFKDNNDKKYSYFINGIKVEKVY